MARRPSRLTAALAVSVALVVAGCGGSSEGPEASENPKAALVAGVSQLSDADALTTTLQLEASADELQQVAASTGDDLSSNAADAISSAQLVIQTSDDKTLSLRAVVEDSTLFEMRVVDKDLYLQGDIQEGFDLADNPDGYAELKAQTAQLPAFIGAFINGDWVSIDSQALQSLAGSLGVPGATASPSEDQGPQLLAELRRAFENDVTVKDLGEDSEGEHLQVSGDTRKLAGDLQQAIQKTVPGGGAIAGRMDLSTTESRTITFDAWVNDGALSKLSLDLAQFDDDNELPAGTELPLSLTFEQTGETVEAPADATPVDLSQLGPLLSGFAA